MKLANRTPLAISDVLFAHRFCQFARAELPETTRGVEQPLVDREFCDLGRRGGPLPSPGPVHLQVVRLQAVTASIHPEKLSYGCANPCSARTSRCVGPAPYGQPFQGRHPFRYTILSHTHADVHCGGIPDAARQGLCSFRQGEAHLRHGPRCPATASRSATDRSTVRPRCTTSVHS